MLENEIIGERIEILKEQGFCVNIHKVPEVRSKLVIRQAARACMTNSVAVACCVGGAVRSLNIASKLWEENKTSLSRCNIGTDDGCLIPTGHPFLRDLHWNIEKGILRTWRDKPPVGCIISSYDPTRRNDLIQFSVFLESMARLDIYPLRRNISLIVLEGNERSYDQW